MTSRLQVYPEFQTPSMQAGIVTGDQIDVPIPMNNLTRTLVVQAPTSYSQQGVQFQASNVASFVESDFLVSTDWEFVITGKTNNYATDNALSPTALWSPNCGGVDQFFMNKLISYMNINIGNRQWTESDTRTDPEMIDMFVSQMSMPKINSQGIYPFKDAGIMCKRRLVGNGVLPPIAMTTAGLIWYQYGEGHTLSNANTNNSTFLKNNHQRYVEVLSNSFATTQSGYTLASVFDGVSLQAVIAPGSSSGTVGAPYYTDTAATQSAYFIMQTIRIRINEYIVSPNFTCEKYTKNVYSKSYPTLGYPVNLQLQFNQQYLKNGAFTIMPPRKFNTITNQLNVTQQPTLVDARLRFFTFDCTKELQSDTLRIYYSRCERQTTPLVNTTYVSQTPTVATNNVVTYPQNQVVVNTANLKYMSRYILLFNSFRLWENPTYANYVGSGNYGAGPPIQYGYANQYGTSELSPYILNPITSLQITYGSQADVVWGQLDMTMRQLIDLTMECLQNPELRQIVANEYFPLQSGSVLNGADNGTAVTINADLFLRAQSPAPKTDAGSAVTPVDDFSQGYGIGAPFLLLDCTKLNFKPVGRSDIPVLPMFNYGSIAYRSLTINMNFASNQDILRSVYSTYANSTNSVNGVSQPPLPLVYNPFVILINDRVRSIPLSGSGGVMGDDEVEFDLMQTPVELQAALKKYQDENNSKSYGTHQLQFVGGANFFGNIFHAIKKALPHVANAIHGAHHLTGLASSAAKKLGLGKRR